MRNAITDLAAVRLLFPIAIQVSHAARPRQRAARRSGRTCSTTSRPYQVDATAPTCRTTRRHRPRQRNSENVACRADLALRPSPASAPPTTRPRSTPGTPGRNPYGNVWANDAVQAARLGLGDQAYHGMKIMLQRYQNYPNGMTNNTNGVFEYLGVHLAAMNEALLQSYNDKIRVFPAAPNDGDVRRQVHAAGQGRLPGQLRARGRRDQVRRPQEPVRQARPRVVNPWGTQQVQVRRASDNAILPTTSAARDQLRHRGEHRLRRGADRQAAVGVHARPR